MFLANIYKVNNLFLHPLLFEKPTPSQINLIKKGKHHFLLLKNSFELCLTWCCLPLHLVRLVPGPSPLNGLDHKPLALKTITIGHCQVVSDKPSDAVLFHFISFHFIYFILFISFYLFHFICQTNNPQNLF